MSGLSKYQKGTVSSQNRKIKNKQGQNPQERAFNLKQTQRTSADILSRYSKKIKTNNQIQRDKNLPSRAAFQHSSSAMNKTDNTRAKMQYRKFISDTQNVPYENRKQLKQIRFLKNLIQRILPFFVFFLLTTFSMMYFLVPIKNCPSNAECGVFIQCNEGFLLNEQNQCQIDPNVEMEAEKYCELMVNHLHYQYGNQDCETDKNLTKPQMKYEELKAKYQIDKKFLNEEILRLMMSTNIQNKYEFEFNVTDQVITPNTKKRSMVCQLKIQAQNPMFIAIGIITLIFVGVVAFVYRKIKKNKFAKNLYDKLRKICEQEKIINVSQRLNQIGESRVDQSLFVLIDKLRVKDQKIMYFEDNENLYWKTIQ